MLDQVLIQHFEKVPSFLAVARLGSIRKAAEAISVSQPALSQTLKKLEEVLEVQLFTRSRLGIKLTPEGETFFESAQKIIENIDLLEIRIRKQENREIKRLRIGTHDALAIHVWPDLIEKFQTQNSNYLISINSNRIDMLTKQILTGDLDFSLTVTPKYNRKLKIQKIYSDNFAFYASARFKGIKKKTVMLKDLAEHTILTDHYAHLDQETPVLREMNRLGFHRSRFFQLNSFDASIRLAEKGLGIAFLPTKIAQNLSPKFKMNKLKVKDMPKDLFKHHICASYIEGNSVAENLVEFIKNTSLIQYAKR